MDEREDVPPIRRTSSIDGPGNRPERMVCMKFGVDFFKIVAFAMQILRLFARIFGDDEDKKADDEVQNNCIHEVEKMKNG